MLFRTMEVIYLDRRHIEICKADAQVQGVRLELHTLTKYMLIIYCRIWMSIFLKKFSRSMVMLLVYKVVNTEIRNTFFSGDWIIVYWFWVC